MSGKRPRGRVRTRRRILGVVSPFVVTMGLLWVIVASQGAGAASSCPPPATSVYGTTVAAEPGLVGYWRVGETVGTAACDAAGTNSGTYTGVHTKGGAGALTGDADKATRFTGGYVSVPDQAALALNGAFTIELWAKPETLPATGAPGLIRKGKAWLADATGGWLLWYAPDTLQLTLKRQNKSHRAVGWKLTSGAWSHIVVTYDGTTANTLRYYTNGQLIGTSAGLAGGFVALTSTAVVEIGKGDTTVGDASVDEVALYGSALSGAAILTHYQAGQGTLGAPSAPTGLTSTQGPSSASLGWTPGAGPTPASYRIYRRNADGTWPTTPTGTSTTTSSTDTAVTLGTSYTYRVTALSAGGAESDPSLTSTLPLPVGFQVVTVASGLTKPTALAWTPDGRLLVTEKSGKLHVVNANGTFTQILDLSAKVNATGDRGLLGIAVDAAYATNHYVYLLYTNDVTPASPDGSGPMASRLTRIVLNSDNTVANPANPETVILGSASNAVCGAPSNTNECIPSDSSSHSIGTVRAAPDGTLWLGSGDASSYATADPNAFRAYNEQSFAGKVMHIDRNGLGLPGHPFCPADTDLTHVCTKLYAKGFRNPFRFSLRASGGPVLGDVGWNTREELDVLEPGKSYGWPCYEGVMHTPTYSDDPLCAVEYAKEGTGNAHVPPVSDYTHAEYGGSGAIVAGPSYSGSAYPASYTNTVVFGDYVHGFAKRAQLDASGAFLGLIDFMPSGWNGVDIEQGPDGSLYWADPGTWTTGAGTIKRWVAGGATNQAPSAQASATPLNGAPPLPVQFTGSGSSDPDGDALTYDWNYGDGTTHGTTANPSHTYTTAGSYQTTLTVDDGHGHTATASVTVDVTTNTAPTIDSVSPANNSTYTDGQTIQLNATASDAQDATLPASAYSWNIVLVHGTHDHPLTTLTGPSPSFVTLTDHDADSYYDITLTVTDSGGLTATRLVTLRPQTVTLTLASNPTGATVSLAGTSYTATTTVTTVPGYKPSVSGTASFVKTGITYAWQSWSDAGAQVHTITVPATDSTLTATYDRPPVAVASAVPTTGTTPLVVQFTGSGSSDPDGDALTYDWDFGDGTTHGTTANPPHTYANAGTFTARLTVDDGHAHGLPVSTATVVITPTAPANQAPSVTASATQTTITLPATASLTGTVTDDGKPTGSTVTQTWSKTSGPGTVTFTTPTALATSATFSTAGVYVLRLTATDTALSGFAEVTVTVNPVAAPTTLTFGATADAYVAGGAATTNYGTATNMHIRSTGTTSKQAFLLFTVAGTAGRTVTGAKVRLYVIDASPSGGSIFSVPSTWTETGLTWNNKPAATGGALGSVGAAAVGATVEFTVTPAITGDGTYSFTITNASTDTVYYATKEATTAAQRPQLVLTLQ